MSVDILGTLKQYENSGGTSINITPAIGSIFGPSIGTAVTYIFAGSIQVDGPTYSLKGASAVATVSGTGSAAPLLEQFQVSVTFNEVGGGAQMVLTGSAANQVLVSDAWPAALNLFPFNRLSLSQSTAGLTVNPGDQASNLTLSGLATLENSALGSGQFDANVASGELGFLGGFIVSGGSGSWNPSTHWPVLQNLDLGDETGVFVSTITEKDLSAFSKLKLPYVPTEIDPGLTFIASITLTKSLAPIGSILPSGVVLDLLANLPPAGVAKATIIAELTENTTKTNAFTFQDLELEWQSTSADSGVISLSITAIFYDGSQKLDLTGAASFTYGATPALGGSLTISGSGAWTHPFGIPNLTIESLSLGFSLTEEGINLSVAGDIGIGEGQGEVTLNVAGGILDFEVPDFILAELSPASKGKSVTLAQLITDFIPSLNLSSFPLLNSISFSDLEFYAVVAASMIGGKQYLPGIGATGDIDFFGYDLDFAFSLVTSPNVAVKAKGAISDNGGPIKIAVGTLNVLTLSDSTGNYGPSACIDTAGSGFCGSTPEANYYFYINAKVSLLGLVSESIVAQASESSFEFDLALDVSTIFSEKLHVEFFPTSSNNVPAFAASISTNFTPPNITLGPWGGIIPKFTIPLPQISLCAAVGTVVPQAAPCSDGWKPISAPYVRFDLTFSWGPIDFSLDVELDFAGFSDAFEDFGSWIVNYVLSNPGQILDAIFKDAQQLARLLLWLGKELIEFAEWVFDKVVQAIETVFKYAYEVAAQLVSDAVNFIEQCATEVANDAMSAGSVASLSRTPAFLADFTESPKGQSLLYHYYLQRPELERICKSDTAAGAQCRELLASYRQHPALAEAHPLSFVIDLIQASAPAGNPEFTTVASDVSAELEKYRNLSYPELLAALRT